MSIFNQIYGQSDPDASRVQGPSFSETLKAGFGLENDVANLWDYVTRDSYTPDPKFNFKQAWGKEQLPLDWMPKLARSSSQQEYDSILSRIRDEEKKKATLAAAGWTGTLTAMGAGILSPTTLIPFAGQAARGKMLVGQAMTLAAAGATASEAALMFNQETRTLGEAAGSVAMGTLLSGMLGAAFVGLSKAEQIKLTRDVTRNNRTQEVVIGGTDSGSYIKARVLADGEDYIDVSLSPEEFARKFLDVDEVYSGDPIIAGQSRISRFDSASFRGGDVRSQSGTLDNAANSNAPLMDNAVIRALTELPIDRIRNYTADMRGVDDDIAMQRLRELLGEDAAQMIKSSKTGPLKTLENIKRMSHDERINLLDDMGELDDTLKLSDLAEGSPRMLEINKRINGDEYDMARLTDNTAIPKTDEVSAPSRITDDIEDAVEAGTAESLSAARSRFRNDSGVMQPKNAAGRLAMDRLGRIHPTYRLMQNKFSSVARHVGAMLDDGGLRQANLENMEPSAKGGAINNRLAVADGYLVDFMKALDDAFYSHITDGAASGGSRWDFMMQVKSKYIQPPAGKLNFTEFSEAVFDGLTTGELKHADIKPAVDAFRDFFGRFNQTHKDYYDELVVTNPELRPLYKELTEEDFTKGIKEYAHQVWDGQALAEKGEQWDREVSAWLEQNSNERFNTAREKFIKRRDAITQEINYLKMDQAQKDEALSSIEEDIEFVRGLPEYEHFLTARRELEENLVGIDKETAKAMRADMMDNLPEPTKEVLYLSKQLAKASSRMKKAGGGVSSRVNDLRSRIDKINESTGNALRAELPKIKSLRLEIEDVQRMSDKQYNSAISSIESVIKTVLNKTMRHEQLLAGRSVKSETVNKSMAAIEKAKADYQSKLERLAALRDEKVGLPYRVRDINLLREEAIRDATDFFNRQGAKVADLEERVAETRKLDLSPEDLAKELVKRENFLEEFEDRFTSRWYNSGAEGNDLIDGDVSFTARSLQDAQDFRRKITTGGTDMMPSGAALRQMERGPQLARVMNIPYDLKRQFLIRDAETVAKSYLRQMGPDLEIWRALGNVNGSSVRDEIAQEARDLSMQLAGAKFVKLPKGIWKNLDGYTKAVKNALDMRGEYDDLFITGKSFSGEAKAGYVEITPEIRSKVSQLIDNNLEQTLRDFDIAIKRLRHQRMVPENPNAFLHRTGRTLKDLNVLTMMGGTVISSISDVSRPIFKYGIMNTVGKSWVPMITNMKAASGKGFKIVSKEINQKIGVNIEPFTHGRAQAFLDLAENVGRGRSKVERGVHFAANKMGIVALFDYWTAGMKSVAANVTHATLAEYVPAVADVLRRGATAEGDSLTMLTHLRDLGLQNNDILRIAQQMEAPNGMELFSNGGRLPNLNNWTDNQAFAAYAAAINTDVKRMIVTPGLERPNWTDENLAYSMVAQFKSFTFASNSRIMMSMLQGNDPYVVQGLFMALAMGAVSYYAGAVASGGTALDRANKLEAEDWIYEAVDKSGILGVLSLGQKVGEQIPGLNQYAVFGGEDKPYRRNTGLTGQIFGPTAGQFMKMVDVANNIDDPDKAESNIRKLRQVFVPFQNVFYFKQMLDQIGGAIGG